MSYPKLLLLDVTPIGRGTATGELKAAYFRVWPDDRLMHIHAVGDDLALAGDDGGHVKLDETRLLQACDGFDPDIVLYRCVGDKPRFHAFALNAIARLGKPYTLWLMDDWLDRARQAAPDQFEIFDRDIRALLSRAAGRYVISPRMAEAFGERYGYNFEVLRNGVEVEEWPEPVKAPSAETGFLLRYAGALAPDTARDSVYEVAEAVEALSETLPVRFEIKTQQVWHKTEAKNYDRFKATSISISNLPPDQYRAWLGGGDAVLIAYNFDPATQSYLKYSFANKIPECLASGAVPLVYGPGELSSVAFLEASGAAETVTEHGVEGLKAAIRKLQSDPEYAAALADTARRTAFESFSLSEQRDILHRRLLTAAETPMCSLSALAALADNNEKGEAGLRLRHAFAAEAALETIPFARDAAACFDPSRFSAAFGGDKTPKALRKLNGESDLASLKPARPDDPSSPHMVWMDFDAGSDAAVKAKRLAELGYTVYISEWYAAAQKPRAWRAMHRYPNEPLPENEGELFAFSLPPAEADLAAALDAATEVPLEFRGVKHAEPLVREGAPETLILLGNGPSLRSVDLRALEGAATLGMNAAFRYWREIDWWPDYYTCLDRVVGLSHREAIAGLIQNADNLGIRKFLLRDNLISELGAIGRSRRVVNFDQLRRNESRFQADPVTTGSHALLWGVALGFERVLLCGIDGQYEEIVPGAERKRGIELEISEAGENPNYFFSDYQRPGDRYCIPNPRPNLHLGAWRKAARVLSETNSEILNTNFSSAVDCFDFTDLESIRAGAGPRVQDAETVFARRDGEGREFCVADPRQAVSGVTFAAVALLEQSGIGVAASSSASAGSALMKLGYGVHAISAMNPQDLAVVTSEIDIETLKRTILSSRACVILPGPDPKCLQHLSRQLRLWGENLYSVDHDAAGQARVRIYPSGRLTPNTSIVCFPGEPVPGTQLQSWLSKTARGAPVWRRIALPIRRRAHLMKLGLHRAIEKIAIHHPLLAHLLRFVLHGARTVLTRPFGLGGGLVITLAALLLAVGAVPVWWPLWVFLALAAVGAAAGYLAAAYAFTLVRAHNSAKDIASRRVAGKLAVLEERQSTLELQQEDALAQHQQGLKTVVAKSAEARAQIDAELKQAVARLGPLEERQSALKLQYEEALGQHQQKLKTALSESAEARAQIDAELKKAVARLGPLEERIIALDKTDAELDRSITDNIDALSKRHSADMGALTEQFKKSGEETAKTLVEMRASLTDLAHGLAQMEASESKLQNDLTRQDGMIGAFNDNLASLAQKLDRSDSEIEQTVSKLRQSLDERAEEAARLEASEAALEESVNKHDAAIHTIKESNVRHTRLLDGMNASNAAGARHFRRRVLGRDIDIMMERWSKTFDQTVSRQELQYLAHQICLIEDRCRGRMAGEIERMMLRLLALRSLKKQQIEVMEIGTLFGVAGAVFHQLAPAGAKVRLTFIDPLSGYYGAGEPDPITGETVSRERLDENMQRLGMIPGEDYRVIQARSESKEAVKAASGRKYDYVLIDGDHSYEGVKRDFELYGPMIEKGGLAIFDDYESPDWPDIARYADKKFKDDRYWDWLGGQWSTGIARRRMRARPVSRPLPSKSAAGKKSATKKSVTRKTPAKRSQKKP